MDEAERVVKYSKVVRRTVISLKIYIQYYLLELIMEREIIILGDIEMGGGTLTDDFIADQSLAQLIKSQARKKHPVELILNGDTFDFLKCPYIDEENRRSYPRHITRSISLKKLQDIHRAHQQVFAALKYFLSKKENQITFVIGNHDHDLFFKEVQTELGRLISAQKNISFGLNYQKYGLYAEHGQQYDFLNKINKHKPWVSYRGEKILNVPWIALGIISNFLTLKEEHPFLERIFPRPLLFSHHQVVVKKLSWRSVQYVLKSLFYYPFRYINDPTYFMPRVILRELYRRFKKVHWDVDSIVSVFKKKRKRLMKKNYLHVLGHVHQHYLEESKGDWILLHSDTWRDEYTLDKQSKMVVPKIKKYVDIVINNNQISSWELKKWPLKQKSYPFSALIKNELGYLKKAAEAEQYQFITR